MSGAGQTAGCVLVTGANRGLGHAIATLLLERGHTVALTWRSESSGADAAVARAPERARSFHFDLRERERPKALVAEIERELGPIVGLVNNAGIQHSRLLAMTTDDDWDAVIDTNLGGTFRCCRAVLPGMVRRRRGAIVNVASLGAERGVAGQSAYAASKAGVLALTRSLAREMGGRNIRVNAVVPGFVATAMTSELSATAVERMRAGEALPAGVDAGAVAEAVLYLLSDAASAITGEALHVDAGASA